MIYLKQNDKLIRELKKELECSYCNSIGTLGVEAIHVGSGSDENLLDLVTDYECPICGKRYLSE